MNLDVWDSGWRTRLYECLAKEGHASVTAFAGEHPALPYRALSPLLGADIAPIQIEYLMREEAVRARDMGGFARDCLARYLAQNLTQGWPASAEAHLELARAFASWSAALGESYRAQIDTVWRRLRASAPAGWTPGGAHDALLMQAFEDLTFT